MQQIPRNRYRRQDVYDLKMLTELDVSAAEKKAILESLMIKSRSRGIEPRFDSLDDVEVKRRAAAEYDTLKDEVEGSLPDFESAYAAVLALYRSLPWPAQ